MNMDKKLSMIKDLVSIFLLIGALIFGTYLTLHDGDTINKQHITEIKRDIGEIRQQLPALKIQSDRNSADIGLLKHQIQYLNKQSEETKQWRESMIRIEEQNKKLAESLDRTNKKLDLLTDRISKWEK